MLENVTMKRKRHKQAIESEFGPMNVMSFASSSFTNLEFSERNPYPGWTACAPVALAASMIFGIFK